MRNGKEEQIGWLKWRKKRLKTMSRRQKKWKTCGYIAMSKSGTGVTIKIGDEYYFAEHPEVLEVLTRQRGYAKIYRRSGG